MQQFDVPECGAAFFVFILLQVCGAFLIWKICFSQNSGNFPLLSQYFFPAHSCSRLLWVPPARVWLVDAVLRDKLSLLSLTFQYYFYFSDRMVHWTLPSNIRNPRLSSCY